MIRDPEYLRSFEDAVPLPAPSSALAILDALWDEAKTLGAWPLDDPLSGIETDIRVAAILNACLKS